MINTRSFYSMDRLLRFKTEFKDNIAVSNALNRISFFHKNVSKEFKFLHEEKPITHIYCFNYKFSNSDNKYIVDEINRYD